MTTSSDTPNPDRNPRTFSSTARLFRSADSTHGLAISHEGDCFVVAVGSPARAVHAVEHGGVVSLEASEALAAAVLDRSNVLVLTGELQRFLLETGGPARFSGSLRVIPPAEAEPAVIEELESDLTSEQEARVSALHQAAAVSSRLREAGKVAVSPGVPVSVTIVPEDVLVFARWIIDGDATVEPVLVDRIEMAADQ